MKLMIGKKQLRIWSMFTAVVMVVQLVAGSLSPVFADQAAPGATGSTYSDAGKIYFKLPKSAVNVEAKGSWNAGVDPAAQLKDDNGDGTFTADITGLTPDTDYTYRVQVNGIPAGEEQNVKADSGGNLKLAYKPAFSVSGTFDNPEFSVKHEMKAEGDQYTFTSAELPEGTYKYRYTAAEGAQDINFKDPTCAEDDGDYSTISVAGTIAP
ncbi:hypothetical protein, partial [Paenibacillus tuaregi]|uniref:hypothetical protein n=1 Tax=Paenibacillus tuaregi TaxID=1816681 RepID=UPI0013901355